MVNEIFYSLQGEGVRAGTPNVFVRFSGCNLECRSDNEAGFDCDTEFTSGTKLSADELRKNVVETMERDSVVAGRLPWIILTGGEPALQVDDALIAALKAGGFHMAIETNGTKELPAGIDWVCVSPKSAEHTMRVKRADEVKYVRHAGQAIPRPAIEAAHYLISPAFETIDMPDRGTIHRPIAGALAWCIQLVKENPKWRLSVQQHKSWMVR
jgi:organic radical activating enzyme